MGNDKRAPLLPEAEAIRIWCDADETGTVSPAVAVARAQLARCIEVILAMPVNMTLGARIGAEAMRQDILAALAAEPDPTVLQ